MCSYRNQGDVILCICLFPAIPYMEKDQKKHGIKRHIKSGSWMQFQERLHSHASPNQLLKAAWDLKWLSAQELSGELMFDKKKVAMKSAGGASSETLMTFTGLIPNVECQEQMSFSEPQSNHYALHFILFHVALIQGWQTTSFKCDWLWSGLGLAEGANP